MKTSLISASILLLLMSGLHANLLSKDVDPSEPTIGDIQNLITLMKKKVQSQFCSKGMGTNMKTIRSFSGAYCDAKDARGSLLLAGLALGVCSDFPGFSESQCAPKAEASIKQFRGSGDLKANIKEAIFFFSTPKICSTISEFVPHFLDSCKSVFRLDL